mmetsp:Transcript_25191/g.69469  ORF Transcript_25191/g.69469 Transcript_25191/m.69469 type:complete len:98 (-) Transcript_25191:187-480(-)
MTFLFKTLGVSKGGMFLFSTPPVDALSGSSTDWWSPPAAFLTRFELVLILRFVLVILLGLKCVVCQLVRSDRSGSIRDRRANTRTLQQDVKLAIIQF